MARVEGRGKAASQDGKVTRRDRTKEPAKIRADDPQTLVGLIWRVIGDPARVVMLIVLLAALAGALSLLLTVIAPVWVHVSVAGGAGFGVLLVSILLRRVRRGQ
jgi:hypothetical protein